MAARISSTIRSQYRQAARDRSLPRRRHPPLSYLLHPEHTLFLSSALAGCMSQAGSTSQQDPSHKRRSLLLVAVGSVVAIAVIAALPAQSLLRVFPGPPPPPGPQKISATLGSA